MFSDVIQVVPTWAKRCALRKALERVPLRSLRVLWVISVPAGLDMV